MSISTMRARFELHGESVSLPSEPLLEGAGVDVEALRERYRTEFIQGQAAPERVWYPISWSTAETEADLRYRIKLWYTVPDLAVEGTIEQAVRRRGSNPFHVQMQSVTFRTKRGPGARSTGDLRSVERYGPGNGRTWRKFGHEVLGFELTDRDRAVGEMHPTLDSALDAITNLDSRGKRLSGSLLPGWPTFVDGEVLDQLRAVAPVNHGIESPAAA